MTDVIEVPSAFAVVRALFEFHGIQMWEIDRIKAFAREGGVDPHTTVRILRTQCDFVCRFLFDLMGTRATKLAGLASADEWMTVVDIRVEKLALSQRKFLRRCNVARSTFWRAVRNPRQTHTSVMLRLGVHVGLVPRYAHSARAP